jgi:hypothetical protein
MQQFQQESQEIAKTIVGLQEQARRLQDVRLAAEDDPYLTGQVAARMAEIQQEIGTLATRYNELNKPIQEVAKETKKATEETTKLHGAFTKLTGIGARLTALGTDILGGAFAPAQALDSMTNLSSMMDNYLRQVGMASEEGRRWLAAQEDIEDAQLRIGKVASEAIVPFMEKVADLAESGARFVEEHPDLVQAFVATGGILVTAGTLTNILSKGIKLFMDAKALAAAALQSKAADTMLKAAGIQASAGDKMAATGPGITKGAQLLGQVVIGLAAGEMLSREFTGQGLAGWFTTREGETAARTRIGEFAAQAPTVEKQREELTDVREQLTTLVRLYGGPGGEGPKIGWQFQREFREEVEPIMGELWTSGTAIADRIKELQVYEQALADSVSGTRSLADALGGVAEEAEGLGVLQVDVDAYIQFRRQVLRSDEKLREDRLAVIDQAAEQMVTAEENYQEQRQGLIDGLAERWVAEDETRAWNEYIADKRRQRQQALALEAHLESMAEAEEDYRERRADTIEGAQEAEEDALKAHQKMMEQLREDYEFRQSEAIQARDAIRYLTNLRQYMKDKTDREEQFQEQKQERREQLGETLSDMKEQHREAMQERQEQWEEGLEQAKENAEFERRIQAEELAHRRQVEQRALARQLTELEESHRDQMSEIRENRRLQLQQLVDAHAEQRQQLNQNLADQLFDEQETRAEFYKKMTADLEDWMKEYRNKLKPTYGMPTVPTTTYTPSPSPTAGGGSYRSPYARGPGSGQPGARQMGGYVDEGLYALHRGEFVLSAPTARMMEQLTGGTLSQERITQMMTTNRFVADMSGWNVGEGVSLPLVQQAAEQAAYRAFTRVMEER